MAQWSEAKTLSTIDTSAIRGTTPLNDTRRLSGDGSHAHPEGLPSSTTGAGI